MDDSLAHELANMSPEHFASWARRSRLDAAGFTPSEAVSAIVHRVEEPKRQPVGSRMRLILDTSDKRRDGVDGSSSVDHFPFVALAETPHVLIYRTSDETRRVLHGEKKLQYDDVTGRRDVDESEIENIRRDTQMSLHSSPFTHEAFFDEATPGSAMFSLLIEVVGSEFRQEVYLFMAHGDRDALRHAVELMESAVGSIAPAALRGYLYYTGFGIPGHGQVLFECFVPRRK